MFVDRAVPYATRLLVACVRREQQLTLHAGGEIRDVGASERDLRAVEAASGKVSGYGSRAASGWAVCRARILQRQPRRAGTSRGAQELASFHRLPLASV